MFQSLRQNSPLYIFYKGDNPRLEVGYVTTQPITKPKYPIPTNIGQTQELVVDIVAKVNNSTLNYNCIPAQLDIADCYCNGESVVISTSKETMNIEIDSLKQKSIEVINSVESHKKFIETYDKILIDLNPDYAEKKKQENEINELKLELLEVKNNMKDLMKSNIEMIEILKLKEKQNEQNVGNT